MNYYNEYEPFAVEWLKELIKDGLIPAGDVDSRSITEVEPSDLRGYNQCHFFAGIGGWAYAARLAGWADDRPMWTGSPPCQPFSVAGQQKGTDDERHLWPVWFNLVRECKPSIIFGEQVSSAIRHGWLDSLQEDLEAENYACAAAVLPASSVGAFHKRDRLWIVADTTGKQKHKKQQRPTEDEREWCADKSCRCRMVDQTKGAAARSSVADGDNAGQRADGGPIQQDQRDNPWGCCEAVQCRDGKVRRIPTEPEIFPLAHGIPNRMGILRGAGNAIVPQVAAEIIRAFV